MWPSDLKEKLEMFANNPPSTHGQSTLSSNPKTLLKKQKEFARRLIEFHFGFLFISFSFLTLSIGAFTSKTMMII
jgi:hypothetical protein